MNEKPNPGSEEAEAAGCTCPAMDNNYGRGIGISPEGVLLFWMNGDCPLHGTSELEGEGY